MRPGKKGKVAAVKSASTRKSTNPTVRGAGKKSIDDLAKASAPPRSTRSGLRSRPTNEPALPFQDNPESILHKLRKAPQTSKALNKSATSHHPNPVIQSIEAAPVEEYRALGYPESEDSFEKGSPADIDPEQEAYRKWGYLAPLDEEVVALIDAIIANPEMAKDAVRIGPENALFPDGLTLRNVSTDASGVLDPYVKNIVPLTVEKSVCEVTEESKAHEQLWTWDQEKCGEASNEAIFQRTIMMSVIARHYLIYKSETSNPRYLDFSVEELWTCPPMPTRAYWKHLQFLTAPKPDLAVSFSRKTIISEELYSNMPSATKRLACYENITEIGRKKAFHFFTIEAKKGSTASDDPIGLRQSLNNASQALHNMFEFCRDAGPDYEKRFFDEARFFSVVASTAGLTIRIHRASRDPNDGSGLGFIIPGNSQYPLRFEYQEFDKITKVDFGRKRVLSTIESILVGYGANKLRLLLREAAEALMARLLADPIALALREDFDFYRHGQNIIPVNSRKQTPASALTPTLGSTVPVDMLRSETETPRQLQSQTPRNRSSSTRKRKVPSLDGVSTPSRPQKR